MKIVTVVPLEKTAFSGILTYFTAKEIAPGNVASVTLRNRKMLALVVSVDDASGAKSDIKGMDFNLKKILDVKESSLFSKEFFEAALETSKYFAASPNRGLSALIPAILKSNYDKISALKKNVPRVDLGKIVRSEKLLLQTPMDDRISIYKTLIRENFAIKKSIFIILPTEEEVKNFYEILSKGIPQFSFAFYSGMPDKKAAASIEKLIKEEHAVLIIATAPYLSLARDDVGVIIVEHESSTAYKTVSRPHMDMRVFAEIYAAKINARFILSDTLLRFETIARKDEHNVAAMHPMSFRLEWGGVIDIVGKGDKFKVLTEFSIQEIKENLSKKKNVFIFSLRKGLATMTVCRDCATVVGCPHCGAPVVLYLSKDGKKRMFICNKCKNEMPEDTFCRACTGWNLMPLGIGTDTVYENLKELMPDVKIFKLDKESAKTKAGAARIVKEFEEEHGAVLIGTEMALFYLKNNIPLSIISSFDSLWSIPNFRMSEKIIQLIILLISKTDNKLVIQTKNTEDPAIRAIMQANMTQFIRDELADRKDLDYPPYKRFIKVTHSGEKRDAIQAKESLREVFKDFAPEIFSGFVGKVNNKYITNMLIKLDPYQWSIPEIIPNSKIEDHLYKILLSLPTDFEVIVDPEDLL